MSGLPLLSFPFFKCDPLGALGTIAARACEAHPAAYKKRVNVLRCKLFEHFIYLSHTADPLVAPRSKPRAPAAAPLPCAGAAARGERGRNVSSTNSAPGNHWRGVSAPVAIRKGSWGAALFSME